MMISKPRLYASVLAVAALGAVGLGYAAPHLGKGWRTTADRSAFAQSSQADRNLTQVADTRHGARPDARAIQGDSAPNVRVDAPNTAVNVDKKSGKVAVRAPYTNVKVDPDRGQVRVRAPYVDLDIRW